MPWQLTSFTLSYMVRMADSCTGTSLSETTASQFEVIQNLVEAILRKCRYPYLSSTLGSTHGTGALDEAQARNECNEVCLKVCTTYAHIQDTRAMHVTRSRLITKRPLLMEMNPAQQFPHLSHSSFPPQKSDDAVFGYYSIPT